MRFLDYLRKKIRPDNPIRLLWHKSKAIVAAYQSGFPGKKMICIGITGTNGKISIADNQEPYASGRYTNVATTVNGESIVSQVFIDEGCLLGTAKGQLTISNYNVTYYYRKAIVYSTTPNNHFKVDSIAANLGATNISINAATINWLSVGE